MKTASIPVASDPDDLRQIVLVLEEVGLQIGHRRIDGEDEFVIQQVEVKLPVSKADLVAFAGSLLSLCAPFSDDPVVKARGYKRRGEELRKKYDAG